MTIPFNDDVGVFPDVFAIDVGNTRAKFGIFQQMPGGLPVAMAVHACVLDETPDPGRALADWVQRLRIRLPTRAIVAGSDPDTRDELLRHWPFADCRPVLIHQYHQIPMGVDVEEPGRVGIDRLLNTWAAWRLSAGRVPVIAVDSGTATTVDLMTADGVFRGGSILPGLRLSAHAMHDYTARLPLLNTDRELTDLPDLPGRNTEDAMRAGLFIGQLGAVRELCERLAASSRDVFLQSSPPAVFVSGGGGRQLVRHLAGARFVDSLALHGLALLPIS